MERLTIRCKNNNQMIEVERGSRLDEVYRKLGLQMRYGPIAAKVNNSTEGMHYSLYHCKDVEFLDMYNASASRVYTRTLFLVCCKAIHDLYPGSKVLIDIPVSKGYYVSVKCCPELTGEDVARIKARMRQIIEAKMPIRRFEVPTEDAVDMFRRKGDEAKVKLLESSGRLYTVYYQLDDFVDYFYGTLLTDTGGLYLFDLEKYIDGMLLRIPAVEDPSRLSPKPRQEKMFSIFKEHHNLQHLLGLRTVGDFNEAVKNGHATEMINVSEALQEKLISRIADEIKARQTIQLVLLAGPSSSGKTTTCKRLSIQLLANGIRPLQISLDDYFINRELTPKDENGEYDYESLYALNIPLINEQFKALFRGEEVVLPKYNFQSGRSEKGDKRLKMDDNNVLVVEGIHALNPELTAQIPEEQKYRVYVSALTTILLDDHNYIPTTDNRLLRRIVRDNKYRGVTAQETIRRWPSVRAGEEKWIFPYQENADAMFNSAMLYELSVLKQQAEPLLEQVPENCEEFGEAHRLLKFLRYFRDIPYRQLPPTSLLREFLGGSSFKY
ncbi:AAA family ATPase [Prevotella sp. oral taxon 376]|uniref:nucleoside kinase n=1 Tax=Prevotella sp. oral taxon 376 TaxID=712466 RepID=UPI000D1F6C17|nr:nucleoside kinase [Prevotella sp. oral taxon 376]PTL33766.1 AAA family ATPase [Prevotella sp. oral taxon 376]